MKSTVIFHKVYTDTVEIKGRGRMTLSPIASRYKHPARTIAQALELALRAPDDETRRAAKRAFDALDRLVRQSTREEK